MIYKWKTAAYVNADAQTAGEVCERLERTVGLTAKTLLDDSRPEDAPLHGAFEWDDRVAAESWRERQAGQIIRCLIVEPEAVPACSEPIRAFYTVEPRKYESADVIFRDAEKTNALLESAKKELAAFRRKYQGLQELAEVFRAADAVLEKVS